jgi:predicted ATPase
MKKRTTELMLERDGAMAHLAEALANARTGTGRLVLIAGEAGIGKTTLVDRFIRDHAGADRVPRGGCDALATPRPLGPLYDMAPTLHGLFVGLGDQRFAAGLEIGDLLLQQLVAVRHIGGVR